MSPTPLRARPLAVLILTSLLAACGGGEDLSGTAGAPLAASSADPQEEGVENGRLKALPAVLPPLAAVPAGFTGNLVCANRRAGAISVDNVEVPAGSVCRLNGTIVRGSVQVGPGGILLAGSGVQITGSVQGDQAAHVQVTGTGSRIGGNAEMEGGGSATLTGVQVGGDIFVNGLVDPVSVRNARVTGNVQFTDNLGGGEIVGNRIGGALQCTGNLPAPSASANVAASIEGQCVPGAGVTPPPPPLTGNVTCVGLTIGAIPLDSVIVPANASCTLLGTRLNGSIEVGANARLVAEGVNVTGDLKSDAAADLRLLGASVIGGSAQVQRGAAATLAGATIRGDLQIDAMPGPVSASSLRIGGNLQAMANRGGVALNGNSVVGVMQCKDNLPAPVGTGNVASLKQDQCLGL